MSQNDDDRHAPLPRLGRDAALRWEALRRSLEKHGYEVTDYREFKDSYDSALLWAENEKNHYRVMAETVGSGKTKPQRFSFSVRTPCMLPPGAKQQQF